MLEIVPCHLDEANSFVRQFHRHHGEVPGAKFSVGASRVKTLKELADELRQAWPNRNPLGQCAVTALVIQDALGGKLKRGMVGAVSHYWNELEDGSEIDFTREQFAEFSVSDVAYRTREYVLSYPDTVARYEALRSAVSISQVCGVAIVGRPVARMNQDGFTLEILRVATDGTKNACSALYAACWRAARAMGYRKVITYVLASESGVSVKAAGFKCIGQRGGGSWDRKTRPRVDKHPTQKKILWEMV